MNKLEIWKPITGYEGFYEISNQGRVRSLDRILIGENGRRLIKGIILKPSTNNEGYNVVNLSKNKIKKQYTVHRLVAETFIPNPDNKPEVDHKNTIKTDNRAKNLRWCTGVENMNNPITKEKIKMVYKNNTKPIVQYTTYNNQPIAWWNSLVECSRFTGIPTRTITSNLIGRSKTVADKGFYFRYAK